MGNCCDKYKEGYEVVSGKNRSITPIVSDDVKK
jgi:hypothetical protein